MMMFVWHRVEIGAELQTDRTVRAEMGAKLQTLDHDQCSLSCAEFHKNNLLSGTICVILYLMACIILENTF